VRQGALAKLRLFRQIVGPNEPHHTQDTRRSRLRFARLCACWDDIAKGILPMAKIELPKKFVSKYPHKFAAGKKQYLRGQRILPKPITGKESLPDLMDSAFLAYNAGRLQEGARLFTEKMLANDSVTVGMSLAGAMTPAGLGASAVIPLIKAGFVDWIVATGANLYHDMHHAMNLPLFRGSPFSRDIELRRFGVVRIYDILLDYNDVLMRTDDILRKIIIQSEFQKEMGTAELHYLIGKYCAEFENQMGLKDASVLAAAYRAAVLYVVAGRLHHRHERGWRRVARQQAARQSEHRRQRDHGHCSRCKAAQEEDRRRAGRWRLAQELHSADRAADSGSSAH
jgi:hypothetical protein